VVSVVVSVRVRGVVVAGVAAVVDVDAVLVVPVVAKTETRNGFPSPSWVVSSKT